MLVMGGHLVTIRNLEGTFQLEAESVFPSLLSLNPKCFLNSKPQPFQTLITRQSYQQKMKHYIIKKPVLAMNLTNSERTPGLPLTGDSELSV